MPTYRKTDMTTERAIATVLITGGRTDISRAEIRSIAERLEVTERSVYRYLDKIDKAKFLIK